MILIIYAVKTLPVNISIFYIFTCADAFIVPTSLIFQVFLDMNIFSCFFNRKRKTRDVWNNQISANSWSSVEEDRKVFTDSLFDKIWSYWSYELIFKLSP